MTLMPKPGAALLVVVGSVAVLGPPGFFFYLFAHNLMIAQAPRESRRQQLTTQYIVQPAPSGFTAPSRLRISLSHLYRDVGELRADVVLTVPEGVISHFPASSASK